MRHFQFSNVFASFKYFLPRFLKRQFSQKDEGQLSHSKMLPPWPHHLKNIKLESLFL